MAGSEEAAGEPGQVTYPPAGFRRCNFGIVLSQDSDGLPRGISSIRRLPNELRCGAWLAPAATSSGSPSDPEVTEMNLQRAWALAFLLTACRSGGAGVCSWGIT